MKIDRLNRQRKIAVTAYLRPGYPPGTVGAQVDAKLKTMNLGQVTYSLGGESQTIGREIGYLGTAFFLGLS